MRRRAERIHDRVGDLDDADAGAGEERREPPRLPIRARERPGREGGAGDGHLGRTRVLDEMQAVQQQPIAILAVGDAAHGGDEGVLAAGDDVHRCPQYNRPFAGLSGRVVRSRRGMKAQLLKRFEDEIAGLERELKTELPKEIQRARELGDLRENAEYKAAKERQEYVNARIAMLRRRVSEISLINLDRIPHGKAAFGSTLTLKEGTGSTLVFQLVMPEDADGEKGWISTASPIGKALMGKEEGDEVKVPTPAGVRTFEILKLATIHDDAAT